MATGLGSDRARGLWNEGTDSRHLVVVTTTRCRESSVKQQLVGAFTHIVGGAFTHMVETHIVGAFTHMVETVSTMVETHIVGAFTHMDVSLTSKVTYVGLPAGKTAPLCHYWVFDKLSLIAGRISVADRGIGCTKPTCDTSRSLTPGVSSVGDHHQRPVTHREADHHQWFVTYARSTTWLKHAHASSIVICTNSYTQGEEGGKETAADASKSAPRRSKMHAYIYIYLYIHAGGGGREGDGQ